MALLDDSKIDITCPNCGRKRSERIGKLNTNPKLTCSCGAVIDVNTKQIRKTVSEVEDGLTKLRDQFGKLGKR